MDRTETPDLGKVIRGLRCCTKVCEVQFCTDDGCPYALVPDDCMDVLMSDALALLKAQEPIAPKRIDGKRNHFLKCGGCNADLTSGMKFCPQCGCGVKWDG